MKGIISDLDGTLYQCPGLQADFQRAFLDLISCKCQVSKEVAERLLSSTRASMNQESGIPPSELSILAALGITGPEWFEYSVKKIQPEQHLCMDRHLVEAMKRVTAKAWIDVATNTAADLAKRILSSLGVLQFLDNVWTPETVGLGKPSPVLYALIADTHGTHYSHVLVLGDRWHIDLVGVAELGMQGHLVAGPEQAAGIMEKFVLDSDNEHTVP